MATHPSVLARKILWTENLTWQATAYGVTMSQTPVKQLSMGNFKVYNIKIYLNTSLNGLVNVHHLI